MKSALGLLTLTALGVLAAGEHHLRKKQLDQADAEPSRNLQGNSNIVGLLDHLLLMALPGINSAIQENAPDPYDTHKYGTYNIGESRVPLWCQSASFDLDYSVGDIVGLSDVYIEEIRVQPGSVNLDAGLFQSEWAGSFIASMVTPGTMIMANNMRGTLKASCPENGNQRTWSIGGAMVAMEPTLGGQVELSGTLCGAGTLNFENASIPAALNVGYSDIVVSIDESPSWLPAILLESLMGFATDMFRDELIGYVEPSMRKGIQKSLLSTTFMSPQDLIPVHLDIMRSNIDRGFFGRLFNNPGEQQPQEQEVEEDP